MPRPKLEIADFFRAHGAAYRQEHTGHLNLPQLKVMSAIESCRTAALGGHIAACTKCDHQHIAYNSCRNRHCPKCQGASARDWMQARMEDLLPVEYFHVVFTLPTEVADIAYQNKAAVYGLLFKASSETLRIIAADPKHLGAKIGITSVLHSWGSAMTHHPHVHVIVPGGGMSQDGTHWIACRPGFFLPVKVLSRLFWRLFLEGLADCTRRANCASSAIWRSWSIRKPSRLISPRCAKPTGSFMPSHPSVGLRRCWPISVDIPTVSRSLTTVS